MKTQEIKNHTERDITKFESSINEGEMIFSLSTEKKYLIDCPLWWHLKNIQQTASGYGNKLTTCYKIQFNSKLYRIYATCYSNSPSLWITVKGKKIFINA